MNVKLIGKHEKDSRACRDGLALTLDEMMAQDKSICYVDCDLMGCINTKRLREHYPDRAFEAGIAEGNAAGVSGEEFDLPYNLIKIIAEQHFSAIASDNIKLITICYISLFSLSPAEVLIDNLAYANENPDLSAIELFERFVNEDKIYIKGKAMSVCDFFDTLIDTFKQVFFKSVRVGIDYIGEVLERIRPAKGFVPILTLITDYQPLSKERIKTLIDFLGMPYSYTDSGDFNPHLHPQ